MHKCWGLHVRMSIFSRIPYIIMYKVFGIYHTGVLCHRVMEVKCNIYNGSRQKLLQELETGGNLEVRGSSPLDFVSPWNKIDLSNNFYCFPVVPTKFKPQPKLFD